MILVVAAPESDRHLTPPGHPDSPGRIQAALAGLELAGLAGATERIEPRNASVDELLRVHGQGYLDFLETICATGGGWLDPDTYVSTGSWETALAAAGAGLSAVDALRRGTGSAAFVAMRPPGHHALVDSGMGFCLLNNVAITARALTSQGERVLIVDWDVHHGNGTQAIFWDDPSVLYVSTHEFPFYPGTGSVGETGGPGAPRLTLNLPLPHKATGDVAMRGLEEVAAPVIERFSPSWTLVSCGFDAHRDDPLADLELTSADFADLTRWVLWSAPNEGRTAFFLEGGYDFGALARCTGAVVAELAGSSFRPEPPSSGGPGHAMIDQAVREWQELLGS